jgi:hypothetical protein
MDRLRNRGRLPVDFILESIWKLFVGKFMFPFYIKSIKSLALKGVPYLYADDITILFSANKYEEHKIKMSYGMSF